MNGANGTKSTNISDLSQLEVPFMDKALTKNIA